MNQQRPVNHPQKKHVSMYFVAEELRGLMASLGFRTINEMIGQSQKINAKSAIDQYKAQGIDLSGC